MLIQKLTPETKSSPRWGEDQGGGLVSSWLTDRIKESYINLPSYEAFALRT